MLHFFTHTIEDKSLFCPWVIVSGHNGGGQAARTVCGRDENVCWEHVSDKQVDEQERILSESFNFEAFIRDVWKYFILAVGQKSI